MERGANMADLTATVNADLAAYYEKLSKKLHKWVDPLSEAQFWRNPFPYGNAIGHLVLHLTGNLNYYVGAQIAHTGYIRERDKEAGNAQCFTRQYLADNTTDWPDGSV